MRKRDVRHSRRAWAPVIQVTALALALTPGWFGDMRRWTPWVHPDDHSDLARQAVQHLLDDGTIGAESRLARNRQLLEHSCGMLDLMENETGRTPGTLEWEYSHFYDPVAQRGIDDRRYVNALEEYRDLWERSLIHLRIDSHTKAFRFLGYCCHLLQDMAVPSHTFIAVHGVKSRTADNLELVSRSRRFYLREPSGPPYPGDEDAHLGFFTAMALESRGIDPLFPDEPNELAEILVQYYEPPALIDGAWMGSYLGEPYYPYHRLLPSSPRIKLVDLVTLRNYLMESAASRTAQLLRHFHALTGAGR